MSAKTFELITHSPAETKKAGRALARCLRSGDVVALQGPLGSGKTTLVKGIARGLGVVSERTVASPTYVLVHEYKGREKIFHLDWYRLDAVQGFDAELAEECFSSGAVTLVEWPERGRALLPRNAWRIRLSHAGGAERRIRLELPGGKAAAFKKALQQK